jgi:uncharacterized membrane protein YkvA (DUF1232 family)
VREEDSLMAEKGISKEQASEVLEQGAKKVNDADLEKVVFKADDIEKMFKAHGPLGRFIKDVRIMLSLVKDYFNGSYREIPWWTIAAVVTALLYVLNPVDLIPDFIPGIGFVDDALVVGVCLLAVEHDLEKYKAWKARNT